MRSRIKYGVVFVAALIFFHIIGYALRTISENRTLETRVYRDKLQKIEKGIDADVIILGDSRSLGISTDLDISQQPEVYNLSAPGMAGTYPMVYIYEKYLDSNTAPKVVVFSADLSHFKNERAVFKSEKNEVSYPTMYDLFYASRYYSLSDILSDHIFWADPVLAVKILYKKASLKGSYIHFKRAIPEGQFYDDEHGVGFFRKDRRWEWTDRNTEEGSKQFAVSPSGDKDFTRLLESAKATDTKVLVWLPPLPSKFMEVRDKADVYTEYEAYLSELQRLYPGTLRVSTEPISVPDDWLIDWQHYNRWAGERVSKEFLGPVIQEFLNEVEGSFN